MTSPILGFILAAGVAWATLGPCFAASGQAVIPLPPGPTPEEVADYALAQIRYGSALASGNGDVATQALYTFSQIAQEIVSRQDPRLFDAQSACEAHRVTWQQGMQPSVEPQFREACGDIAWRYNEETIAVRRDLEVRIAAADRAVIAQAMPATAH